MLKTIIALLASVASCHADLIITSSAHATNCIAYPAFVPRDPIPCPSDINVALSDNARFGVDVFNGTLGLTSTASINAGQGAFQGSVSFSVNDPAQSLSEWIVVSGGVGTGFFAPDQSGGGSVFDQHENNFYNGSGPMPAVLIFGGTCVIPTTASCPFTFGVPIEVTLSMQEYSEFNPSCCYNGAGGTLDVTQGTIVVEDSTGNVLTRDLITEIPDPPVPEPSALAFTLLGFGGILWRKRRQGTSRS